ncbi:MAG: hypothetical protein R3B95_07920 [Nitrospirales bacterium]|nr:hypothetical protein [Nitrospirales bacterium]
MIGELNDAYQFFPYKHTWYASDYPTLDDINLPAIAIYGHPRYFELGGQDWLALNPVICAESGVGDFALLGCSDGKIQGRIMVESVWWQDGPINREPCEDDICSEGWMVLASKEALRQSDKFQANRSAKGVIRKITKGMGRLKSSELRLLEFLFEGL